MSSSPTPEDEDLYTILNITPSATKSEIKKAYHKAALSSHPDKVPREDRATAEITFKSISRAYEILSDDDKRHLYDTHGMSAFSSSSSGAAPNPNVDMEDILAQMFGGMGGVGGAGLGGGGAGRRPRRGEDEEQEYEVTLAELYKGKTTRFSSTKNVICNTCTGTGGKASSKPKTCETCEGKGLVIKAVPVGPGLYQRATVPCSTCDGAGKFFREKDRCKKCKGKRTVQSKKLLELYIPPGSREGEKIVLKGEADQHPDQSEPGDLVFHLVEKPHEVFRRAGSDLACEIEVALVEALTGFQRMVVRHLDGRGISVEVKGGRVLRPDQVLRVRGEGMPVKRSAEKGDLYLVVRVKFPEDGWLREQSVGEKLRALLPKEKIEAMRPEGEKEEEIVDEVEFDAEAKIEDFGAGSGDPRGGAEWEDEEDEGQGAQCAQQ